MAKYRKKPVEIEAFKYNGDLVNSHGEWCVPNWAVQAYKTGKLFYGYEGLIGEEPPTLLFVKTSKGRKLINVGDYVILRDNGEISPCDPEAFDVEYETVDKNSELKRAVMLLNSNGYYIIKSNKRIKTAIDECVEMDECGGSKDCCGCLANICLLNMDC